MECFVWATRTVPQEGVIPATALQKSHLIPLPASQVYIFANVKLFTIPLPIYCVALPGGTPVSKPVAVYGVPPVVFKSSMYGAYTLNCGNVNMALELLELPVTGSMTLCGIEGLEVVMKLPQIAVSVLACCLKRPQEYTAVMDAIGANVL